MPDNPTRRPHVVPVAYLQFWDSSGDYSKGRRAQLYITDGDSCRLNAAGGTGIVKQFYSKSEPNNAEDYFKQFEGQYARLIKTVLTVNSVIDVAALQESFIIHAASLLARSHTFNHNYKEEERIDNVQILFHEWLKKFDVNHIRSNGTVLNSNNLNSWGILILNDPGGDFITSDNPVSIITLSETGYDIYLLPISPHFTVCILNRDKLPNAPSYSCLKIGIADLYKLNQLNALNAVRENYSNKPFSDNEAKTLKALRINQNIATRNNFINQEEVRYEPFKMPTDDYISFIGKWY